MSSTQTQYFYGVGRRKASTARAKFYPSKESGLTIQVNKKDFKTYFPEYFAKTLQEAISNLKVTDGVIHFFIKGGGQTGQIGAARLALTKALVKMDPAIKSVAKTFKYLSTDIRKVLPKRPGLRKARKREQWSKR
jgi:small subunit ribosomal protein S9